MRIIAVDDKPMPRRALVRAITEAAPDAEVCACANAGEVLGLEGLASYDVAFIDIDMPGKNGIELARDLKEVCPTMNLVFATGYGEYMADAFALHSSGYVMKPVTTQKVAAELENLRYPPTRNMPADKLYVQCFGNFEVFWEGKPVMFSRGKTKELFAYLIDRRGATCSIAEIEAVIWENEPSGKSLRSFIRTLIADMRLVFDNLGCGDVVVKSRGVVGIRTDLIVCDYYSYLNGDPFAIASYRGEYMHQYSWAESTLAGLGRA